MSIDPRNESLHWLQNVEDGQPGDIVRVTNVQGVSEGFVVARNMDESMAEEDIDSDAWLIPRVLFVTWAKTPVPGDIVLCHLNAIVPGSIVSRSRTNGLSVYVKDKGELRHEIVADFLRMCFTEHVKLAATYSTEKGVFSKRADGYVFETLADLLAHAMQECHVDVLSELREQPGKFFSNALASL